MTKPLWTSAAVAAAMLLAACAGATPPAGPPVAAAAPAAVATDQPPAEPMDAHRASAQCWMKYDKTGGSLESKSKLVDKCIDDTMKAAKR